MGVLVRRLGAKQEIQGDADQQDRQQDHQPARIHQGHGEGAQSRSDRDQHQRPADQAEIHPSLAPEVPQGAGRADAALNLVGGDGGDRVQPHRQQGRKRDQPPAPGDGVDEAGDHRRDAQQGDDFRRQVEHAHSTPVRLAL